MLKSLVLLFFVSVANGSYSWDRKKMEDTICSLCGQRKGCQPAGQQIAFYAYMSSNIHMNTFYRHKIFVYDTVETNIGNGYDARTGKFIAPQSGVYVIHTTTVSIDYSASIIEIVKNGVVKDVAFADSGNHDDRDTSSTLTILKLKKGDAVYTRVGSHYGGRYLESNNYARTSFSGFKLM